MSFSQASLIEPSTAARQRRTHLVVSSAHGVVEVDIAGSSFIGVLAAPGSLVGVGDALGLKLLCRADNAYPNLVEGPQEFTAHVLAVDDADVVGERQLLSPGLGLTVALSPARDERAPPMPVVVGASLDEALANMLAEQLEPADLHVDDDPDVITGSLRRLPLTELVQALSLAGKTAAIHLRVPGGVGVIYLDDGEVACAQLDDDPRRAVARGASAFARLLACDRGSFRVSFEKEWHERNVHGSTQALLLDGLVRLDESRRPLASESDSDSDASASEDPFELEEVPVRPAMRSSMKPTGAVSVARSAPRSSTR